MLNKWNHACVVGFTTTNFTSRTDITINWIYDKENESIEEAGEDFIEDFENLNINLVTK
jgi:hypothetical protein